MGVRNGTATVQLSTDGGDWQCRGFANALVEVTGTVFQLADPVINNAQPIAFGSFREGALVTAQALSITNNAADDGFQKT